MHKLGPIASTATMTVLVVAAVSCGACASDAPQLPAEPDDVDAINTVGGASLELRTSGGIVAPNDTLVVKTGLLHKSASLDQRFYIRNVAAPTTAGPLRVRSVGVTLVDAFKAELRHIDEVISCFGADGMTPCKTMTGQWGTVVPVGVRGDGSKNKQEFVLRYKRPDSKPRRAAVFIDTHGDGTNSGTRFQFFVNLMPGRPELVLPAAVSFGQVKPGTTVHRLFTAANSGDAVLYIDEVTLPGDGNFQVEMPPPQAATMTTKMLIQLTPPIAIAPGKAAVFKAGFSATNEEPTEAWFVLATNDFYAESAKKNRTRLIANAP